MLHRLTSIFFNLFLAASTVIIQSTIWLQDNYLYLRELYFVKMWMSYFQMIKIRGRTIGKRLSRCRIQDFTRGFQNFKAEFSGFPLGLENLEKWEGIFQSGKSQGILNRLEKSGKITQNTGKVREFEINII